tara:strand:+ start:83 stop:970 length:888 start_codon:yes stop_codon:yes gene_type:complete
MSESGLVFLKNLNPYERDNRIRFEDEGHRYYLDGVLNSKSDGWVSCTSLVHDLFPVFNKDLIIKRMMSGKNWKEGHKYWGMTKEQIIKQWDDAGLESRELGTKMHLMIEQTYNQDDETNIDRSGIGLESDVFSKFYEDHLHLKPHRTEMLVFDEELKITGSIDMIFENPDGTLSIYDWKRSKDIEMKTSFKKNSVVYELRHLQDVNGVHYSLQLNIYKKILERNYNKTVKDLYLIRIHPENNSDRTYEKIKCLDLSNEVDTLFALRLDKLKGGGNSTITSTSTNQPVTGFSECLL